MKSFLLLCLAISLPAQVPETTLGTLLARGGLAFSREAKLQADSAWLWGATHRTEPAMCVAPGGYAYGVAFNGRPFILVLGFTAANVRAADSLHVYYRETICGDSLPSWHGHIVSNEVRYQPSPCDMQSLAKRSRVPFALLQSDTNRIRAYARDTAYLAGQLCDALTDTTH